jgi:hypothetical protein
MGRVKIHSLRFQGDVGVVPNFSNPTIPHYLYYYLFNKFSFQVSPWH